MTEFKPARYLRRTAVTSNTTLVADVGPEIYARFDSVARERNVSKATLLREIVAKALNCNPTHGCSLDTSSEPFGRARDRK